MLTILQWVVFHLVIAAMLAVDLGLFQRKAHAPSLREAASLSVVWILAAVLFNIYVYFEFGDATSMEFTTAYVVEKALSVDNLFVFTVIFGYFGVDFAYQHKVLFWGILGAILTRATFIVAGVKLIETFHWMVYVFACVLIYTGFKMARRRGKQASPEKNFLVKQARKLLPITPSLHQDRFFVNSGGRMMATPLLLTLVAIESTDIMFAVDSVPAVLAITTNLFIAYTSNILAILGLRALYFVLIEMLLQLKHLHIGLAILLTYMGAKMLMSEVYKIPTVVSLLIVTAILATTAAASLMTRRREYR